MNSNDPADWWKAEAPEFKKLLVEIPIEDLDAFCKALGLNQERVARHLQSQVEADAANVAALKALLAKLRHRY